MKVIYTNNCVALCWFNLDNNIQVVEVYNLDKEFDCKIPYSNGEPLKRYYFGLKGNKPFITDGYNEYPYDVSISVLLSEFGD